MATINANDCANLVAENDVDSPVGASIGAKRKHSNAAQILHQRALRNNQFHYLHLSLMAQFNHSNPIDEATAMLNLQAALGQFLGLTGTAIPIDILKLEEQDVWIRVPNADSRMVISALSSWVGGNSKGQQAWTIRKSSDWLLDIVHDDHDMGQALFNK